METESNASNRQLVVLGALNLADYNGLNYIPSGRSDLGNNDMVVQGSGSSITNAPISYLLSTGFDNGSWDATGSNSYFGVYSSAADRDSTHLHAFGYIAGQGSPSLFDGYSVHNYDELIKYTLLRRCNLDGKVDGSDYSRIDSGYLTYAMGWSSGDFNYDNVIDGSDYTLIDNRLTVRVRSFRWRSRRQLPNYPALPKSRFRSPQLFA